MRGEFADKPSSPSTRVSRMELFMRGRRGKKQANTPQAQFRHDTSKNKQHPLGNHRTASHEPVMVTWGICRSTSIFIRPLTLYVQLNTSESTLKLKWWQLSNWRLNTRTSSGGPFQRCHGGVLQDWSDGQISGKTVNQIKANANLPLSTLR